MCAEKESKITQLNSDVKEKDALTAQDRNKIQNLEIANKDLEKTKESLNKYVEDKI